jgi:hypothetical protein
MTELPVRQAGSRSLESFKALYQLEPLNIGCVAISLGMHQATGGRP